MKSRVAISRGVAILKRDLCYLSPYGVKSGRGNMGNSGFTATVFGSNGALGNYVMNALAKSGTRVYAPFRGDDMEMRHLKVYFSLGQLGLMPFHPRNDESIYNAVKRSDVVINLIGKHYETKHFVPTRREDGSLSRINYTLDDCHNEIPARIAKISKEAGVQTFVHVSALSADFNSKSEWSRSKARGEVSVREAFPDAVIVKPAHMFSAEDRFTNWIGDTISRSLYPFFPVVEGGNAKIQPIFAGDVAEAIMRIVEKGPEFAGQTFQLAGKETYTYAELVVFCVYITMCPKDFINIPKPIALLAGRICEELINPWITKDMIEQICEGAVLHKDKEWLTLEDLAINPRPLEECFNWLHRFRPGGHYAITKGYHSGHRFTGDRN